MSGSSFPSLVNPPCRGPHGPAAISTNCSQLGRCWLAAQDQRCGCSFMNRPGLDPISQEARPTSPCAWSGPANPISWCARRSNWDGSSKRHRLISMRTVGPNPTRLCRITRLSFIRRTCISSRRGAELGGVVSRYRAHFSRGQPGNQPGNRGQAISAAAGFAVLPGFMSDPLATLVRVFPDAVGVNTG